MRESATLILCNCKFTNLCKWQGKINCIISWARVISCTRNLSPCLCSMRCFCRLSTWLKRHQLSNHLCVRSQLHAQTSEVAYCLDLFPSVPVNILITNQTAYYNERQPRPSAGMGKLCSETTEISEPFAPMPLSDFRWIAKGHYANDKNQKYIKHANADIQQQIIIKQGQQEHRQNNVDVVKSYNATKKGHVFSAV